MKHFTVPDSQQKGTFTSKINSPFEKQKRSSKSLGKISLLFLFLLVSQIGAIAQACPLACRGAVNVTLDATCNFTVQPDILLTGTCSDFSQFSVEIVGQTGNVITAPGTYDVKVIYNASGNFCWGTINAEDKSAPICTIDNPIVLVSCGETVPATNPTFEDCTGVASTSMVTLNFGVCGDIDLPGTMVNPDTDGNGNLFDDLPFTVSPGITFPALDALDPDVAAFIAAGFVIDNVTVNMWTATDVNGFSSTSCQQYIYSWRPSAVNPPQASITVECGSAIDPLTLAQLDPTFVPHYNNPLYAAADDNSTANDLEFTLVDDDGDLQFLAITDATNTVCRFNVNSEDNLVAELCGMTQKYIREFTVIDWCEGSIVNTIDGFDQIIIIDDSVAPEFQNCPTAMEVGGSFDNPIVLNTTASASAMCGFDGILTPPNATDFCSAPVSFSASIYTSGGTGTGFVLVSQVQDLSANVSLPFNDYRVDFVATDECGNVSDPCTVYYDIRDNTAPVAICDQFTTVSLTNALDGTASICAINLDSGSSDNCGIATRMIRRMNTDDDFMNCLDVNCGDAGQDVIVELRVTDAAGNSNLCWVTVTVEDKSGPTLVCPADITISCMDPTTVDFTGDVVMNATSATGNDGYATDNCGINFVGNTSVTDVDCGQGVIEREFTAFTSSGIATCTQTITIMPDFDYFVTFPADITIEGCADMVNVDNAGEPVVSGETCAEVGINVEDQIFVIQSGACNRLVRTYTVRNTCIDVDLATATPGGIAVVGDALTFQDDGDGYFVYTQTIDIIDNTPPTITTSENQFFDTFNEDCTGNVNVDITATDNCTMDLSYSWSVDIFGNGSEDMSGTSGSIDGVFPVGVHTASISVSDGCGNTTTSQIAITVSDRKNPTPFCTGVNTVIMNGDARAVEIWANDLLQEESTTDNCTNNEDIIISVSLATDPNPSVAPTATSVTITCDDLVRDGAGNALPTTFQVQVFVQDEAGNFDFCTVDVEVIDTENDCGTTATGSAQISGRIYNENDEDVEDVTVQVETGTGTMPSFVTQTDGAFLFPGLDMNEDYMIEPVKDINVANGISTNDLVLLTRHILAIQALDSPYKILAADVNLDGALDIGDLLEMRQLILFSIQGFSSQRSWIFIDSDYQFNNPINPLAENVPQVIGINNLSTDIAANFIGVKLGDLDNSSLANRLLDVDTRSFDPIATIAVESQKVQAGEEVSVPFHMTDVETMSGMQFTIEFDPASLEFTGFNEGILEVAPGNFGFTMLDEGVITFSWNTVTGNTVEVAENDLFELSFIAKQTTDISSELNVSSKYTAAVAFSGNENYNVELNILSEDGTALNTNAFELYQNQPNPFKVNTSIGFKLPEASFATLTILDISGKELRVIKDNFVRGYNEINLDLSELDVNGVLYYQLETASHTATKKMIVIK